MMRTVLMLIVCAAAFVANPVFAGETCKPVTGHFEATVLPPSSCSGILCTEGRVWGGLQGTYAFTATALLPSNAVPSVVFFTGDSAVTTQGGDLLNGTDTGSLDIGPNGGFASLITFTGGSGELTNASGQIRLRGQLDQASGTTSGDYTGTICTP